MKDIGLGPVSIVCIDIHWLSFGHDRNSGFVRQSFLKEWAIPFFIHTGVWKAIFLIHLRA